MDEMTTVLRSKVLGHALEIIFQISMPLRGGLIGASHNPTRRNARALELADRCRIRTKYVEPR
jgi:hypothetical protein